MVDPQTLIEARHEIDRFKGYYAFGGEGGLASYSNDALRSALLSHFGFWKLDGLRREYQLAPGEICPPGTYQGVAVVMADLCGFSSFMRDTPDDGTVRDCLTSFYSKARYQIINHDGMLYKFVGDEVIGFFGIPNFRPGFIENALDAARSLVNIGLAVANHWQRCIDRVQSSKGVHIRIALGDLQMVSLRPFSRASLGALGECINMASRLMSAAKCSEIVVSNSFYRELDETRQEQFVELEPIEARNLGLIKAWKASCCELSDVAAAPNENPPVRQRRRTTKAAFETRLPR